MADYADEIVVINPTNQVRVVHRESRSIDIFFDLVFNLLLRFLLDDHILTVVAFAQLLGLTIA
jgi:hypothetical protein